MSILNKLIAMFTHTTEEYKYFDLSTNSPLIHNLSMDIYNEDKYEKIKESKIFTENAINLFFNIIKGNCGEEKVRKEIERLAFSNSICLHNVCIPTSNNQIKQFDFIWITSRGIYIIEAKFRSAKKIIFDENNYIVDDDFTHVNPISQITSQKQFLEELLNKHNIHIPITEFIVYTNSKNNLLIQNVDLSIASRICKLDTLNAKISDHYHSHKHILSYKSVCTIFELIKNNNIANIPNFYLLKKEHYQNSDNVHLCETHHYVMHPRWSAANNKFFLVCPCTSQHNSCKTFDLVTPSDVRETTSPEDKFFAFDTSSPFSAFFPEMRDIFDTEISSLHLKNH